MTEEQLINKLNNLDLILVKRSEEAYVVQRPDIGNPLLFFNPKHRGNEYSGTIQFKAYNIKLYHPSQVYPAIELVDEFLLGKLANK